MAERTNQEWITELQSPEREDALADLRALLVRGLRYAMSSRPNVTEDDLDNWTLQSTLCEIWELDENMKNMKDIFEKIVLKSIKRLMKKYSIPVFFAGPYPYRYPWMQKFIEHDIPIFSMWDDITKCLSILYRYAEYRKNLNPKFKN